LGERIERAISKENNQESSGQVWRAIAPEKLSSQTDAKKDGRSDCRRESHTKY